MVSTATLPAPARVPFRAKFHNGLTYICNILLAGWDVSETWGGHAIQYESAKRSVLERLFHPCSMSTLQGAE